MRSIFLFLVSFLCLFSGLVSAQEQQRPKVGLVLSGGGAKGFAHIGVLKVLEEEGVKIDYISGTSMGAIIGALYASGYTANQLDSIFRTVDATALMQDYVPRISKSFYEKRNDEIYAIQLPFDDFKIGTPVALSKGMYNYNLLSRLLGHMRYVDDFSQLPIPFVCIATDILTGEQVVLNQGNLPQSILASGAFPSLYTPVEIDGKTLIDGGVANNYPIDEVRAMGADIVIGVDVQEGLKKREDIRGATDVLMQIANYGMYKGIDDKISQTDIYIKPDIVGYNVVSFDRGLDIIEKGVEATQPHIEKIRAIASGYHKAKLPSYQAFDTISLKRVEINEMKNFTRSYVLGKLPNILEDCIPFTDLETGINNLNGTQNFTGINYRFLKDEDSDEDILQLNLTESPYNRFLKFGLHYDQLYKSSLLINVTQKKLLSKNDVASLDFVVGDNVRYNFNYFIDNGIGWSFGLQSRVSQFRHNIRSVSHEMVPIEDYQPMIYNAELIDFSNRFYIQTYYRNRFLVGLGVEHKFQRFDANNAPMQKAWIDKSHYLIPYFSILLDTYDNKYFPTRGIRFATEVKHFMLSSDYNENFEPFSMLNAEIGFTKTFFNRLSFRFLGDIGITVGSLPSSNHKFYHGGYGFESLSNLKHFYGYNVMSLNADSYLKTTFTLDYRFYRRHHLNFSANFAQLADNMFETTNWIDLPRYSGYALGYGFQSMIGPVEIKQSYSPEVKKHFTWFAVGFWF